MARKTERKALDYYLNLHYPVTLYPEREGGYTAEVKDLPGCVTQGETLEGAMEMVEDARRLWLETAYEFGDEIPLPSTEEKYSGKVLFRMPRSLHQRLAEGAEREGISLNQHMVSLLSEVNALWGMRGELQALQEGVEGMCQQISSHTLTLQGTKTSR